MNLGHRVECIWSMKNPEKKMNNKQLDVRKYIIQNNRYPEYLDILIINSAYETGWNLNDIKVKVVVVNSTDKDTITQVRGRVRQDIKLLLHRDLKSEHSGVCIPSIYISKDLTPEDLQILCKELNLYNSKGRLLKWSSIKKIIDTEKYTYKTKRKRINGKQITITRIDRCA